MLKLLISLFCMLWAVIAQADSVVMVGFGTGVSSGSVGITDQSAATTTIYNGTVYYEKFQPTSAGTVSYGHIYVSDSNGSSVCLSLHSSDGTKLLSAESSTITDGVAGWVNLSMGGSTSVSASTDYYLGVRVANGSGSGVIEQGTGDATGFYIFDSTTCGENISTPGEAGDVRAGSQNLSPTIIFNNSSGDPS